MNNIVIEQNESQRQLKSYFDRALTMEKEKASVAEDIKELYEEAKANGFDAGTLKKCVAEHKKEEDKRREQYELFKLYAAQLELF